MPVLLFKETGAIFKHVLGSTYSIGGYTKVALNIVIKQLSKGNPERDNVSPLMIIYFQCYATVLVSFAFKTKTLNKALCF